jgi:glycosyltransferase involved in cell wall biosynthesis
MATPVPKVSIGLPVYNGEKYLRAAVNSILQQDYTDFELVISDNASSDATEAICRDYAAKDPRVRYSRNPSNIGLAPNHNRVFDLSRGEFFKWVAHDDEYSRQMIRRYVEAFDAAPPSVSMVYSVCECIDELGNPLGTRSDHVDKNDARPARRLAHLLRHASIYNCTYGLVRSSMLRKTRLHGSFPMADRVLVGELAMLGVFVEIAEPLLRLRLHEGRSLSQHKDAQALRELFDPANKTKRSLLSVEGRVQLELLRSAWLIPPRFSDKLACVYTALAVTNWRNFRNFGGLQKIKVARMLGKTLRHQPDAGRLKV